MSALRVSLCHLSSLLCELPITSRHREQCCFDNEGFFCLLKTILKPPLSPVSFLLSSTGLFQQDLFPGLFCGLSRLSNHPTFFLREAQLLLESVTCCLKSNNFMPRISSHIFQKFILWSVTAFKHHSGMLLPCPTHNTTPTDVLSLFKLFLFSFSVHFSDLSYQV